MATLAALALTPALAAGQSIPEQGGSEVIVESRSAAIEHRGELLAVTPDSLWILTDRTITVIPTDRVLRVRVDRGVLGSKMNWTWSLVVGGASGLLLTAACNSVADADCGGVFVGSMLSWLLFGGIAAPSMTHARWETIRNWQFLIPYARFPAGIPEGAEVAELVGLTTPD